LMAFIAIAPRILRAGHLKASWSKL
jgi:hypothetical protein